MFSFLASSVISDLSQCTQSIIDKFLELGYEEDDLDFLDNLREANTAMPLTDRGGVLCY